MRSAWALQNQTDASGKEDAVDGNRCGSVLTRALLVPCLLLLGAEHTLSQRGPRALVFAAPRAGTETFNGTQWHLEDVRLAEANPDARTL